MAEQHPAGKTVSKIGPAAAVTLKVGLAGGSAESAGPTGKMSLKVGLAGKTIGVPFYVEKPVCNLPLTCMIYKSGGKTHAVSGVNGAVIRSGSEETDVFQAALEHMTSGGRLFVKSGVYDIGKTLNPVWYSSSDIVVEGEGTATVLRMANGSNLLGIIGLYYGLSRIRIRGLKLDGNSAAQTADHCACLYVRQCSDVDLQDLWIADSRGRGVWCYNTLADGMQRLRIAGCKVSGHRASGVVIVDRIEEVQITNNHFWDNCKGLSAAGIFLGDIYAAAPGVRRLLVANNQVRLSAAGASDTDYNLAGIHLRDLAGETLVIGNTVEGCGSQGYLFMNCASIEVSHNCAVGNGMTGFYIEGCPRGNFNGNHSHGNGLSDRAKGCGFAVASWGAYKSDDCVLMGNQASGNGGPAVVCDSRRVLLAGNGFEGNLRCSEWRGTLRTRAGDDGGVFSVYNPTPEGSIEQLGYAQVGDLFDVVWSGGSRSGMAVAACSGNDVTLNGGIGDPLPAVGTTVGLSNVQRQAEIMVYGSACRIQGNKVRLLPIAGRTLYHVSDRLNHGNRGSDCRVENNDFFAGDAVGGSLRLDGTGHVVRGNRGWATENRGAAIVQAGQSSVVVQHGLVKTPTLVKLTGTHAEVSAAWVSDLQATTFKINVASAATADRVVLWEAET